MRKISIAEVKISQEGKRGVLEVLSTNRLTYGPYTERFEKQFATLHSRKHALFVNSGTSALQIGLHAASEKRERNHNGDHRARDHVRSYSLPFQKAICSRTRFGAVPPKLVRERTDASSDSTL